MEYCVICKELSTNGLETVELRQKGSDGINNASKLEATHSKLLQDSVYIKNAGRSFLGRTVFRHGHWTSSYEECKVTRWFDARSWNGWVATRQWLLSMPACAIISSAMQEFTSRCYASSGQHKEMTKPRQARDDEDSRTLLGYLQERNPFDCDLLMRNISTGVTGDCTVNADRGK